MNKYKFPSFPVSGNFAEKKSFAENVRQVVANVIRSGGTQFAVVEGDMGGGYALDFCEDDYWQHPIKALVFLNKPEHDYANMAEVVEHIWQENIDEENAQFEIEDFDIQDVSVFYLFENEAEANEWLAEFENPICEEA